jgi:hypothetical protein
MSRLAHLFDETKEDVGLRHARERQFLQRQPKLWGNAVGRLLHLESSAYVWSDEEVAAHDARVLELAAELFAAPGSVVVERI